MRKSGVVPNHSSKQASNVDNETWQLTTHLYLWHSRRKISQHRNNRWQENKWCVSHGQRDSVLAGRREQIIDQSEIVQDDEQRQALAIENFRAKRESNEDIWKPARHWI